jgi:hypothetical protein
MKTLFASALLALTLGTTVPTFAAPATDPTDETTLFQSAVRPLSGDRVEVAVTNTGAKKLTVRLLDAVGQTMAIQFLGKAPETTRFQFDLSAVPSGTYQVEIAGGSVKQVKSFTIAAPVEEPARTVVLD